MARINKSGTELPAESKVDQENDFEKIENQSMDKLIPKEYKPDFGASKKLIQWIKSLVHRKKIPLIRD